MTVGERIRERRESMGLSQTDLAIKIGLKHKTSITKIEQAGDNVSLKHLEKISKALSCRITYLMGFEDINGNSIMDYSVKIPCDNGKEIELLVDVCRNLNASDIETLIDMAKVFENKRK